MNDFVAMEKHVCMVCGAEYDTGALLVHKRMQDIPKKKAVTGVGLCPEHHKLFDEGYVALIECDPARTTAVGGTVMPGNEYRTGPIAHVRRSVLPHLFDVEVAERTPVVFVEQGVIAMLQAQVEGKEGD